MREIDASEAQYRLDLLLDSVEQGEEFVITRCGRPVARLVPACGRLPVDREEAHAAARRIRERSKGISLGGLSIKDLIEEGRE